MRRANKRAKERANERTSKQTNKQTNERMLSFERCLDQRHRRRAGPEFVADWAMVLKLTMGSKSEIYELYSTSKESFCA